ncbi:hypothetical protein CHLRE_12g484800v5 [Chlamydomonas reinhardtii]|uniref:Protein kinase domain-containing protein n=1 Tax=Chlamydomonas reinhardtii TaxID=3055 RepID=A0A2K3D1N7_CHLRE|nr:uncharacterized protein CHLRE_12g484800v5 [Chlamydomonas reinhardtii]PNW74456.1 hypothetical protein CHLRE_12g484800v5 [Chlamydomonas reinhardtii]
MTTLPIAINQNTTIFGAPELPEVIVQISARGQISLGPRITLTFLDIMLETPPKELFLQQPGLSLIHASPAQQGARLVLVDVVLWGPLCFNASDRPPESARPVPRPASEPGVQNYTESVPQTGCVNSTAALVLQRCWADRSAWNDFAFEGRYVDSLGTQRPNNYTVRVLNMTLLCRRMLTSECVAINGGAFGCYLHEISNGTLPPLDLGQVTVVAPRPTRPDGSSGSSDGPDTLAIVLGCVLGGVGLLSAVGLAVWWRHRSQQQRRRQQQAQQQQGQAKHQGGTGAAVVHVGIGGSGSGGAASWLRVSASSGGKGAALSQGVSADMSASGPLMSGTSAGGHTTPPHSGRGMTMGAGAAAGGGSGMGGGMGAGPGMGLACSSEGALEQQLQSTTCTATHTSGAGDSNRSTLMLPLGTCIAPLPASSPQGPAGGGGGGGGGAGGSGPSFPHIHVQDLAAQRRSPGSTHDPTGATDVVVAATPYQPSLVLQLQVDESGLGAAGADEASAAASAAFGAWGYSSHMGAASSVPGSALAPPHHLLHHAQALHQPQHQPQHHHQQVTSGGALRNSDGGTLPAEVMMGAPGAPAARPAMVNGVVGGAAGGGGGGGASQLASLAAGAAAPAAAGGRVSRGSTTGLVDAGVGGASGSGAWDASWLGGGTSSGGIAAANATHPSAPSPGPGAGGAGGAVATTGAGSSDVVTLLPVVRGRGAFGRVTEGLWRGQRVAVKQMLGVNDGAAAGQSDLAKSFKQEVEVLGRCAHPNVVKLFAASLEPPRLCLVMELCETSLERLLFGTGPEPEPVPLGKVLHIAMQICQGLAYLHPTIVHRDLKPANVLINSPASDRPTAKLTDFGLARMRAATLPTMEPEAGTTAYLAPECFDVENAVITHQADMYSLGVVLWTMLAAREPWKDQSLVAVAFRVSQGQRLPLDTLGPERCPPKLRRLIESLWDHDPLRRPAAAEVLKLLVVIQEQLENAGGRTGGIGTAAALLGRTAGGSGPPGHMHTPSAPSDAMSPAPARALSSAASLPLTGGATGPEPAQHQGPGQGPPDGPRVLAGPQEQLQMEAAAAVAATEKRGSAQAAAAATAAVEAADAETGGGA